MKIIVSSSALAKRLKKIGPFIAKSSLLPVLDGVLIQVKEGIAALTAGTLEMSITVQVPVEGTMEGAVVAPYKLLTEVLLNLPDQPVSLVVGLDAQITLSAVVGGEGETLPATYTLAGECATQYPLLSPPEGEVARIPGHLLRTALEYTAPFTSTDELRRAMMGVRVRLDSKELTLTATDGQRLVEVRRKGEHVYHGPAKDFIVPALAARLLTKFVEGGSFAVVNISPLFAVVEVGEETVVVRLIDEKFPNSDGVIPFTLTKSFTCELAPLQASVRRVLLFANKAHRTIVLKLSNGVSSVEAEDQDYSHKAREMVSGTYSGSDVTIGFDGRLLKDFLALVAGKRVRLRANAAIRGVLLESADFDSGVTLLLMPKVLSSYLGA